jgi:hypothetical protein
MGGTSLPASRNADTPFLVPTRITVTRQISLEIWEEGDDSVNMEKSNGSNGCVKNGVTSFLKNL